jgi:DNA-binding MarR family transcriptional regulator
MPPARVPPARPVPHEAVCFSVFKHLRRALPGDAGLRGRLDGLGLSYSALSKQLATLEQAGYVEIRRGFVGKRPRTSARLTPAGRAAFEQHVAALQEMVAGSGLTIVPR